MSNKRELAKLASEIKEIKAELNKESASTNVFSEMIVGFFPGFKVEWLATGPDAVTVLFKSSMGLSKVTAYSRQGLRGSLVVTACKQGETGLYCSEVALKLHQETSASATKKIMNFLKSL